MAGTGQNRRYSQKASHRAGGTYVDGNTVRRVQTLSEPDGPYRQPLSRKAKRNQERARSMTRVFVVFLTIVCTAVLVTCVRYLQLKSQIIGSIQTIAELESTYSQLKADNDAYESRVNSSVDLNQIKQAARERLGMKYPSESQIFTYQMERGSYVRQYQEVPDAK